jgi:hypothetical protein
MCSRKVQVEKDHASVLVSELDAPCLISDVSWRSSRAPEASVVGEGEAGRGGKGRGVCLTSPPSVEILVTGCGRYGL